MKNLIYLITLPLLMLGNKANGQESDANPFTLSIGILQGGSLIGADLEYMLNSHVGIQAGVGIIGFSAAYNYHFKPGPRSSFISGVYWHQGLFGELFGQNIIGGTYVYRGRKWFTAQIGLGVPLAKGALLNGAELPPVILLYSLGIYLNPE